MPRDASTGWGEPPASPPKGAGEKGEIDLFDLVEMAWAERGFILILFLLIAVMGAAASFVFLKPVYESHARMLVLLDQDPTPGAAGAGGAFTLDQVMQSEAEILDSDAVRRGALARVGPSAVSDGPALTESQALRVMRENFSLSRAPSASVIVASYEHPNAETSALVLNAIIDAYLAYRVELLAGDGVGGVGERRARADAAYAEAQAAMDAFLREHDLSNFEADRSAAVERLQALQTQLLQAGAERDAAAARAAALAARINAMPESVELYVENGASNRLLELRMEREDLLSRYLPESPPVQAIERQIDALQAFIAAGGLDAMGMRRMGANPVRQSLETERAQLESLAASESRRATSLQGQIRALREEISRLGGLAPQHDRLARDLAARGEAAQVLTVQEAAAAARRAAPAGAADSVRIVERATPADRPKSLRRLGLMASVAAAAGIALFAGLIRGYWREHGGGGAGARPARARRRPKADVPAEVRDLPVLARVADRSAPFAAR